MSKIYSEKELLPHGCSLGQWEFTLSNDEINGKLESLPKGENNSGKDCGYWENLLSLLIKKEEVEIPASNDSVVRILEDEPMECSSSTDNVEERKMNENSDSFSDVEDITASLVDSCNQAGQKFKTGFYWEEQELAGLAEVLQQLDKSLLSKVAERGWSLLNSDASRTCFSVLFCLQSDWCEILCKQVLVSWMSQSLPSKLETLSEIFSKQGEVFCRNVMVPLLKTEDSPFVKDLLSVEEIMTSMSKSVWTLLLKDLLSGLSELCNWTIPVLAVVVEHSEPSYGELCVLVQLMSSAGPNCAKSRDFGALLVAVSSRIKPGFGSVVPQMKLITNNYKGPLKFKALKVLNDVKD